MEMVYKLALFSGLGAAIIAFLLPTGYWLYQRKRKIKASIHLIARYAEMAVRHIEENCPEGADGKIMDMIRAGNPFGETEKDYTPFILFSEEDRLPFSEISKILQHLKTETKQLCLLEYFVAQAKIDAISYSINSDFVRSLPQERKEGFWRQFVMYRNDLLQKAKKLEELLKDE